MLNGKILKKIGKIMRENGNWCIANDTNFYTISMSFAYYERTTIV